MNEIKFTVEYPWGENGLSVHKITVGDKEVTVSDLACLAENMRLKLLQLGYDIGIELVRPYNENNLL